MRHGTRTRIALLIAAVAIASCARGPESVPAPGPVHFFQEDVTVVPSSGRLRVSGLYAFRNETNDVVEMGIAYPFPVDDCHAFPDTIRVTEMWDDGTATPVEFAPRAASVLWAMRFEANETRRVRVEYSQPLSRSRAVYIVTTTAAWARPIDVADFHFKVPRTFEDVRFSFAPDGLEDRGDTVVYHMHEERFLPESDLEIEWR